MEYTINLIHTIIKLYDVIFTEVLTINKIEIISSNMDMGNKNKLHHFPTLSYSWLQYCHNQNVIIKWARL